MRLTGLLPLIHSSPAMEAVRERLRAESVRCPAGVSDAAKPAFLAALLDDARAPALIVTPRPDIVSALVEELTLYLTEPERILVFPESDTFPYERVSPDVEAATERLRVLRALADGIPAAPIVVTCGMALAQRTLAPAEYRAQRLLLQPGNRIARAELLARLLVLGYETASLVERPGQASHRGGIVDLFSPAMVHPLRVELLGDRIESLREFDVTTQRTVRAVDKAEIAPAREASAADETIEALLAGLDASQMSAEARDRFEAEVQGIRAGDLSIGAGFYLPFLSEALLLDHLPSASLIVVDEPAELGHVLRELDAQAEEARSENERRGTIPAGLPLVHANHSTVESRLEKSARRLDLHRWESGERAGTLVVPFASPESYAGRLRPATQQILESVQRGERVVLTSQQSARLRELFRLVDREPVLVDHVAEAPEPGSLTLLRGAARGGWTLDLPDGRLTLVTDAEMFGFTKRRRPVRMHATGRDAFIAQLAPGDYVVHVEHGIGVFKGLVRRNVGGIEREYLELQYADRDRLLVPTDQVDRVSRFVGPSDRAPAVTHLGTSDWSRAKERVRRAVTDLAQGLLNLYAAREVLVGHGFSPDQAWQHELEASFPYVETPDQLRTLTEVKGDMESERPMDRVIVGDVGYGKTEIALRAAFKAVLDGMQVAVLVPTTVLAQQHLQTFRERLSGFPTRVEALSRFRNDREVREILTATAAGEIDILIGTHRLLGKDVVFKNLGLVVVDEEQRFGVQHKERLKHMREEVDVLTLSATPIPRTLHQALSGIRDMSTVASAPEDRSPIKTYVAEFDERLIREAILRELDRNGQVYFVHNRVQSIERMAAELRRIVPEARVCVGHGQMPEDRLERVMVEFQAGEYDVLVCTTIIESGLDIPNVNTLIANRADRLGLAQLYQLRGRVGRGINHAFAYLLYDRNHALTETAQKRLQAIFEASELGAGFQIALRDLEIRGAGNLLGAEQSGHIGAVGFELYNRMLGDAVSRLQAIRRGEPARPPAPELPALQLDLPFAAYIPETYVPDLNVRLTLYQSAGRIASPADADELLNELEDRFGDPPPVVYNLLYALALKGRAREAGVASILLEGGQFVIRCAQPVTRREQIIHRFARDVEIGTTQVRVRPGSAWPRLLYDLVCAMADIEENTIPRVVQAAADAATVIQIRSDEAVAAGAPKSRDGLPGDATGAWPKTVQTSPGRPAWEGRREVRTHTGPPTIRKHGNRR